ncbi:putative membrane protein [Povalibacter uvarum]|uniref:Putative membrane protein n=1 Tax=Povalibacter uvarum TaxID=732238 RepID=A0A841HPA8_9GAMM|nr:hypothetical protein [Povalibacter uvarum]MBB6095151.1 putative membrane protein [Povalibacter uvarum]
MNKLLGFVRTTLIGGVLYLVPIVLLMLILGKAFGVAHRIVPAFSGVIDKLQLGHLLTPQVFAVLLVVVFCFAAGLFSRTVLAREIGAFLDAKVLINVPGYGFFRSMGGGSGGIESFAQQPVIVSIEDEAWQIAFVVEKLGDSRIAVFVPGVPEVRSGSLYFLAPDRVRPLNISSAAAFQVLRRMGVGSDELLRTALKG